MKRTNKIWKGLALLLALCMFPTAALANSGASVTLVGEVTEAEGAFTVNAHTTVPGNDITILAFRAGETVNAFPADAELEASLVFIDQVASDEEGNATFSFIPRAVEPSLGGYVHIYVGGEDMTGEPAYAKLDSRPSAPVLGTLPTTWYAGHDVLDFAVTEELDYLEAWAAEVEEIRVTGVKENDTEAVDDETIILPADLSVKEGAISINMEGLKSVSEIVIDGNGIFTDAVATFAEPLVRALIPAGSVSVAQDRTVSPVTVTFSGFADAADAPDDWAIGAAIRGNYKWAKADGEVAEEELDNLDYEAFGDDTGTGTEFILKEPTGEAKYYIQLAVENCVTTYYGPYTVTSPATDAREKLEPIMIDYDGNNLNTTDEAYDPVKAGQMSEEELARAFGAASITLPPTGENGTRIAWTKDGVPVSGTVSLERPASGSDPVVITFVATITVPDTAYTDEWVFTKTVNPYGVSGVDITIDPTTAFPDAKAAKVAIVTLKKGDSVVATAGYADGFAFDAVTADTYTIVVARPGYVTATVEVTVTPEGLPIDFAVPTMIAGDIDGHGDVYLDDLGLLGGRWDKKADVDPLYDVSCDLDGDGHIYLDDLGLLGGRWGYGLE